MADDIQSEVDTDSIWAKLGITDPEEEYVAEEATAEADAEKEDKILKKLSARVDNLDKKYLEDKLQQDKDRFLSDPETDELERELFKGVIGLARDPETLAHAIELTKKLAAEERDKMAKYEEEARAQVERSWGVTNPGRALQPTDDEAKAQRDAIAQGDTKAGFAALISDDSFLQGRV
jgi:hypothetical protein